MSETFADRPAPRQEPLTILEASVAELDNTSHAVVERESRGLELLLSRLFRQVLRPGDLLTRFVPGTPGFDELEAFGIHRAHARAHLQFHVDRVCLVSNTLVDILMGSEHGRVTHLARCLDTPIRKLSAEMRNFAVLNAAMVHSLLDLYPMPALSADPIWLISADPLPRHQRGGRPRAHLVKTLYQVIERLEALQFSTAHLLLLLRQRIPWFAQIDLRRHVWAQHVGAICGSLRIAHTVAFGFDETISQLVRELTDASASRSIARLEYELEKILRVVGGIGRVPSELVDEDDVGTVDAKGLKRQIRTRQALTTSFKRCTGTISELYQNASLGKLNILPRALADDLRDEAEKVRTRQLYEVTTGNLEKRMERNGAASIADAPEEADRSPGTTGRSRRHRGIQPLHQELAPKPDINPEFFPRAIDPERMIASIETRILVDEFLAIHPECRRGIEIAIREEAHEERGQDLAVEFDCSPSTVSNEKKQASTMLRTWLATTLKEVDN